MTKATAKPAKASRVLIDYPASLKRLLAHIDAWNEDKDQYQRLKQQHKDTAERIIGIFYQAVEKTKHSQPPPPAIRSNGAGIATQLRYTRRTFDRHIAALQEAGIASMSTAKELKIRAQDKYESYLRINPQLIVYYTVEDDGRETANK